MAWKHQVSSFYVFLLLTLYVLSTVGETMPSTDHKTGRVNVEQIVNAISEAGYLSMSLMLETALSTLIALSVDQHNNSQFTIFCPLDEAFFSLKYPQPPLTLLQYHIVPMKLDRESLEYSSSPVAIPNDSMIDTLLPGHPLVLSSFTDQLGFSSINFVKITKWELYNDGYVVVHGIEEFFDPAYQTLLYPWYDNNNETTTAINDGNKNKIGASILQRLLDLLKEQYSTILRVLFSVFFVATLLAYSLSYASFCYGRYGKGECLRRRKRDAEYEKLDPTNIDAEYVKVGGTNIIVKPETR